MMQIPFPWSPSMSLARSILVVIIPAVCLNCSSVSEPSLPRPTSPALSSGEGVLRSTSGGGQVDLTAAAAGYAVFSFTATILSDGTALGHFRQSRIRNGLVVDFSGIVTCMTVDAALGRARIGGRVTENNSTDPAFLTENHEVGDDVWFRVEDGGEGQGAVDASTTYGFKPTLVDTSEQYCALPFTGPTWNPLSIFPLRGGNIQVRP
jgi:hypothetical protein